MKVQLIDSWQSAWKMFSIWFFVILGALPELFNLAVASGLIDATTAPKALSYTISLVAFAGAASRLIKQKALEANPTGVGPQG